jgi:hypothetical protein
MAPEEDEEDEEVVGRSGSRTRSEACSQSRRSRPRSWAHAQLVAVPCAYACMLPLVGPRLGGRRAWAPPDQVRPHLPVSEMWARPILKRPKGQSC